MSLPPPPQDPQEAAGGGFGPPQGFGPPTAPGTPQGAAPGPAGGFGPPGGYAPHGGAGGPYGPPPPGGPGGPQYGMAPPPPGGGNRGTKVAAIVVGAVLVAAVAVGGVLWLNSDGDDDTGAEAAPSRSSAPADDEPASRESEEPEAEQSDASSDEPDPSTSSPGQIVPYVVLEPGECFDHPSLSSDVKVVEKRSCNAPHNGEVISNDKLTGTYDNAGELRRKVMESCKADANKRVSPIANGTRYYFYAIYPSLPTYERRGDDTISCAVTLSNDLDGKKLTAPLPE